MLIQPYLNFDGRCEEAIEFYRKALGAEVVMMSRMKDMPEPRPNPISPEIGNKIMHATLRIGESIVMASDGHCKGQGGFQGISLSISPKDADEAGRVFNALAEGGSVTMPLGKTFWSPAFGMLVDRFGLMWMVNVTGPM